jgi:hypothetical protein
MSKEDMQFLVMLLLGTVTMLLTVAALIIGALAL